MAEPRCGPEMARAKSLLIVRKMTKADNANNFILPDDCEYIYIT